MTTPRLSDPRDEEAHLHSLALVAESATTALRPVMREQQRIAAEVARAAESTTAALRPVMREQQRIAAEVARAAESTTAALRPVMREQERIAAVLRRLTRGLERRRGARARESRSRAASCGGRGARGRPARRSCCGRPSRRGAASDDPDLAGSHERPARDAPRGVERSSLEAPRTWRGAPPSPPALPPLLGLCSAYAPASDRLCISCAPRVDDEPPRDPALLQVARGRLLVEDVIECCSERVARAWFSFLIDTARHALRASSRRPAA
jgi:hypothetical protein